MKSALFASAFSAALLLLPAAAAAEQVLGVYLFHRHGDRTAKAWEPVNLTSLGADQVHAAGAFYRDRYVTRDASRRIRGISSDIAVLDQLAITAPIDNVLHGSALVFTQGLYPPTDATSEKLANGTTVEAPLNGYQTIPVNAVDDAATGEGAESDAWLQGSSGCDNAEASSNNYLSSDDFNHDLESTKDFYEKLAPVIKSTYGDDERNFKNAYAIFDLINVATIHNSSIPSDDLLTDDTLDKLYDLASTHEWNLAFNSSDPVRGIAGQVLAGQIVDALEAVVQGSDSAVALTAQFGAYGTFMSFFGHAQLPAVSEDFYGVCDYASSMAFELVTNATDANPAADDISVRFYFSNGTAADDGLKPFPLFGGDDDMLSWNDFKAGMGKFAIKDTAHWCDVCGNTDGTCAKAGSSGNNDDSASGGDCSSDSGGISKAVAGVIGAIVTLVVILGLEAAVMLIGGLRLAKKSTIAAATAAQAGNNDVKS